LDHLCGEKKRKLQGRRKGKRGVYGRGEMSKREDKSGGKKTPYIRKHAKSKGEIHIYTTKPEEEKRSL